MDCHVRSREDIGKNGCSVFGKVTTWDDKMEKMNFGMIVSDHVYIYIYENTVYTYTYTYSVPYIDC